MRIIYLGWRSFISFDVTMKHLLYLSILCSLSCSVLRPATVKSPIHLDQNGVTVISTEDAVIGESYELDGVSYLVVDSTMLYTMVANDEDVTKVITTNVTDMSEMFQDSQFNGDISKWDVSKVTDMSGMFMGAFSKFNGDISNWDVSNVTDMSEMFQDPQFNGDISNWDVSKVTDMSGMFMGAFYKSQFNGDISNWDVSNVTDMLLMFNGAISFNQDLSSWDVSNVTNCGDFSTDATAWTLPKPTFTKCTE